MGGAIYFNFVVILFICIPYAIKYHDGQLPPIKSFNSPVLGVHMDVDFHMKHTSPVLTVRKTCLAL